MRSRFDAYRPAIRTGLLCLVSGIVSPSSSVLGLKFSSFSLNNICLSNSYTYLLSLIGRNAHWPSARCSCYRILVSKVWTLRNRFTKIRQFVLFFAFLPFPHDFDCETATLCEWQRATRATHIRVCVCV